MQPSEPPVREPSLFVSALIGCLAGLVVGAVIALILAIRAGNYYDPSAFMLIACISGLGALSGFEIARWRRKRFGAGTFAEEWRQFSGSRGFGLLVLIVLGGSFGLAFLGGHLFDAMFPPSP